MLDEVKRRRKTIAIILNPEAGRGRGRRIEKNLVEILRRRKIPFVLERTKSEGHATDLARELRSSFDIIFAAGGDGTVNEVAAGLAGGRAALAVLPIGSGNDFNREIGTSGNLDEALSGVFSGSVRYFDMGSITTHHASGVMHKKVFLNTVGIGLDAEIAREAQRVRWLRGLPLYLFAVAKTLVKYQSNDYEIHSNGKKTSACAFLLCGGNGSYEGGGFRLLPDARTDDQVLDWCMIKTAPILNALHLIPRILKGTHGNDPMVSMWRSRKISIEAKRPFTIHADGEIVTDLATKATIGLAKERIRVVVPTKGC